MTKKTFYLFVYSRLGRTQSNIKGPDYMTCN